MSSASTSASTSNASDVPQRVVTMACRPVGKRAKVHGHAYVADAHWCTECLCCRASLQGKVKKTPHLLQWWKRDATLPVLVSATGDVTTFVNDRATTFYFKTWFGGKPLDKDADAWWQSKADADTPERLWTVCFVCDDCVKLGVKQRWLLRSGTVDKYEAVIEGPLRRWLWRDPRPRVDGASTSSSSAEGVSAI